MPLIHFQQRFADAVAAGTKRQTIRKERKRPIKRGDKLILGTWEAVPYRSKVRRLGEAVCTRVDSITIGNFSGRIDINGHRIEWIERYLLALADGFGSPEEMMRWFEEQHGLPFAGVIIGW